MDLKPFNARRAWIIILGSLAVFIACGPFLEHKGRFVSDLYDFGIIALPCSAILYTAIYTFLGFRGRAKRWLEDVGMAIVTPYIALIFSSSMLAWAALFNNGALTTSWEAWIYIGAVLAATGLMLWRSYVWVSTSKDLRKGQESPEEPEQVPTEEKG